MISKIKLFEKSIYKNILIINLSNRLLSSNIEADSNNNSNNNNNNKKSKKPIRQLDSNDHVLPFNSDAIISLCKRKGFVYQSSEIYSPLAGFFDYGPLGVELKNNLKSLWWKEFVKRKEDIVGIDCSIISSSSIWNASGHISGFSDPMVDCKGSKLRFRADQVFWGKLETLDGDEVCYISILESDNMVEIATKSAIKKAKKNNPTQIGPFKPLILADLTQASSDIYHNIPSPATGEANQLTPPRDFNLMFQTSIGATSDASSIAYLRPETAQGIFTNFINVQRTSRMKIPFGIAQIGKAFRNEITPRNFIFRSREFEQMEIEFFIPPGEDVWPKYYNQWVSTMWDWLISIGLNKEYMSLNVHKDNKLAHYAKACTDINFTFPFGTQELMGIAARGNYDLTQHQKSSGKSLEYFDQSLNIKYIPACIEPSIGLDRLFLAILTSAYKEEVVDGETRILLSLHPSLAPIKIGIFPLVNNKIELTEKARNLYNKLLLKYTCEWDNSGAIGRRYRRSDEAGIPFCITVDFDSLEDDSVTVRYRDSMEQIRIKISELDFFFSKELDI